MNGADLPFDEACALARAAITPLQETEEVLLDAALGRILDEDLHSPLDIPPYDNSAMDGYAFRVAAFSPEAPEQRLRVIGRALAGHPYVGIVGPQEAVRVMTGAPLPHGCNVVVMQERVRAEEAGEHILVPGELEPGANIRRCGEELAQGDVALAAGRRLTATDLGLIAGLGFDRVTVKRRLRVAVLSSGDELVPAGTSAHEAQIHDSNRPALLAMLRALNMEAIDAGLIGDDPDLLEQVLRTVAPRCDAIVSSGGVSVGEADHTRTVLARLGEVRFHQVALRPGRPLAVGKACGVPYFGLPGNPVASTVAFTFIVRQALLEAAGASDATLPTVVARAARPLRKRAGRTEFPRGVLGRDTEGRLEVQIGAAQGSSQWTSLARSDCYAILPAEASDLPAGASVTCVPFAGLY